MNVLFPMPMTMTMTITITITIIIIIIIFAILTCNHCPFLNTEPFGNLKNRSQTKYNIIFNNIYDHNQNLNNCAKKCRGTIGCYGFTFDPFDNRCTMANDTIDQPDTSPDYVICNKQYTIIESIKDPSLYDRRNNALYLCKDPSLIYAKYLMYKNDKLDDIGEKPMIDQIFDVDDYGVVTNI